MTKATELRELASLTTISSGQIQFDTDIKISGDLITTGNTINITADTLNISDPNITLASGAANSAFADGAGITIDGASASLYYTDANDSWNLNKALTISGTRDITLNSAVGTSADANEIIWRTTTSNGYDLASIKAVTEGNFYDGGLAFQTSIPGYANGLETKMRILMNGSVGIGTDDPTAKLHIVGGSGLSSIGVQNPSFMIGAYTSQNLSFDTNEIQSRTNGVAQPLLMQKNGGEVCVGDSDPAHTLDVAGDINARSSFRTDEVRHSIRPTLNLDFANSKSLDPRIMFSRGSINSTYYDDRGILRYAEENEPRFDHDPITKRSKGLLIEATETNYSLFSNYFKPGSWNGYQGYAYPAGAKSPDGKFNAWRLSNTNISSNTYGFINKALEANVNTTVSVYAKAGSSLFTKLGMSNRSAESQAVIFDLVNGVVTDTANVNGTVNDAGMQYVGDGWYRCWWNTNSTNQMNLHPLESSSTDAQTIIYNDSIYTKHGFIYIFGSQAEKNRYPSSYQPNKLDFVSRPSSASYWDENGVLRKATTDQPRYSHEYDTQSQSWVETGLLLERANTNNIYNSKLVYNANGNSSIVRIPGPDGVNDSAVRVTYNGSGGAFITTTASSLSGTHVFSVWMRKVSGNPSNSIFSYENSVGLASVSKSWDSLSNDLSTDRWVRVWATFTFAGTGGITIIQPGYDAGAGVVVDYFAPQLEAGTIPTSYIETIGSTVTRAEDVYYSEYESRLHDCVYIEQDNISEVNQYEGSLFTEFFTQYNDGYPQAVWWSDLSTTDIINIDGHSPGLRAIATIDNSAPVLFTATKSGEVYDKVALAFDNNDCATSFNGSTAITDTSSPIDTLPKFKRMYLGSSSYDDGASNKLNGYIKKISYYPVRLSNAELQSLTENN